MGTDSQQVVVPMVPVLTNKPLLRSGNQESNMAVDHKSVSGSYDKSVPDSGDGQSKSKFSNPINKPTDDLPKPSQSVNQPKDSKDTKVS
jgi:hypothetical protein